MPRLTTLLLATLALYAAFAGARILRYGDASAMIGFGCHPLVCYAEANLPLLPENPVVYASGGYDGQFYYWIAAELAGAEHAIVLDAPTFRRTRILYPLLAAPAFRLGADALVLAMLAWPLVLQLLAIAVLHRFFARRVGEGRTDARSAARALWLFAWNPFALVSFGWALADGLALALLAMGLAFYLRAGDSGDSKEAAGASDGDGANDANAKPSGKSNRPGRRARPEIAAFLLRGGAVALLGAAVLAKETAVVIPLALLASGGLELAWVAACGSKDATDRRAQMRAGLLRICLALIPIAALAVWYAVLGYSPFFAAARGADWPFQGLVDYLKNPDALLSGRSFLVGLLGMYVALAGLLAFAALRAGSRRARLALALCAILLLGTTLLVAQATADEYWKEFLNIARLFAPGVIALVFLPGDRAQASRSGGISVQSERRILAGFASCLLLFSLWVLRGAWLGGLLPVVGAG